MKKSHIIILVVIAAAIAISATAVHSRTFRCAVQLPRIRPAIDTARPPMNTGWHRTMGVAARAMRAPGAGGPVRQRGPGRMARPRRHCRRHPPPDIAI